MFGATPTAGSRFETGLSEQRLDGRFLFAPEFCSVSYHPDPPRKKFFLTSDAICALHRQLFAMADLLQKRLYFQALKRFM